MAKNRRNESGAGFRQTGGSSVNNASGNIDLIPFSDWSAENASTALSKGVAETDQVTLQVRKAYYEGDHWQNGEAYIGPRPAPQDKEYQYAMSLLERENISRNKVKEVCVRHGRAVVGWEPQWGMTSRKPLKIGEAIPTALEEPKGTSEAALTDWWDKRGVLGMVLNATCLLMWSERRVFRLYIPRGKLKDAERDGPNGTKIKVKTATASTIEEALDMIYIEQADPGCSRVYTNEVTKEEIGIYRYRVDNEDVTELTYREGSETVVRVIRGSKITTFRLPFGGRLTMQQIMRESIITKQVIENQRALNLCATTLPKAVITAGYLERVFLNAQAPGHWVEDPNGGGKRWVDGDYHTGPETTAFIRGMEFGDPTSPQITTPSVQWREASPTDPAITALREFYLAILEECDQAHIILSSSELPSGISREQARADFEHSLRITQVEVEKLLRWILETALAMAEGIISKPGLYTRDLRADVQCQLNLGPVSAEDQTAIIALKDSNVISMETARTRSGVSDVDAERMRVELENTTGIDYQIKRAEVLKAWMDAGCDQPTAMRLSGVFTDEEVKDAEKRAQAFQREPGTKPDGSPAPRDPNAEQLDLEDQIAEEEAAAQQ